MHHSTCVLSVGTFAEFVRHYVTWWELVFFFVSFRWVFIDALPAKSLVVTDAFIIGFGLDHGVFTTFIQQLETLCIDSLSWLKRSIVGLLDNVHLRRKLDCCLHSCDVWIKLILRRARPLHIVKGVFLNFMDCLLLAKGVMQTDLATVAHYNDQRWVELLLIHRTIIICSRSLRLETNWHEAAWAVTIAVFTDASLLFQSNRWFWRAWLYFLWAGGLKLHNLRSIQVVVCLLKRGVSRMHCLVLAWRALITALRAGHLNISRTIARCTFLLVFKRRRLPAFLFIAETFLCLQEHVVHLIRKLHETFRLCRNGIFVDCSTTDLGCQNALSGLHTSVLGCCIRCLNFEFAYVLAFFEIATSLRLQLWSTIDFLVAC